MVNSTDLIRDAMIDVECLPCLDSADQRSPPVQIWRIGQLRAYLCICPIIEIRREGVVMQLSSAMFRAIRGILGILGVCIVLGASGKSAARRAAASGWYMGAGAGANWSSSMEQMGHNRETDLLSERRLQSSPRRNSRRLSLALRPGSGYRCCVRSCNRLYVRRRAPGIVSQPAKQ